MWLQARADRATRPTGRLSTIDSMYIRYIQPRSKPANQDPRQWKRKVARSLFLAGLARRHYRRWPAKMQRPIQNAPVALAIVPSLLSGCALTYTHTHPFSSLVANSSRTSGRTIFEHSFRCLSLPPSWPGLAWTGKNKKETAESCAPFSPPFSSQPRVLNEHWISLGRRIENFHWDSRIRERNLIAIKSDLILYSLYLYVYICILDENY